MRKILTPVLAAIAVLLLAATAVLWQRYQQVSASYTGVKSSEDAAETRYAEALNAIAEIQDSLSTLGVADATRPVLPGSPTGERGLSALRGREALDRIALLKAGVQRTKGRIADLERNSKRNGVQIAGLEHLIDNLRRSLAEKESIIAQLGGQVDTLHAQVADLTTAVTSAHGTLEVQAQTIVEQRRELGTVYWVAGARRDLLRSGAIVATGGLFGIGQTLQPSASASDSLFATMDTDADRVIRIAAPKARVLSAQPASSYSVLAVGTGTELHILDPRAFRTVNHVVILANP